MPASFGQQETTVVHPGAQVRATKKQNSGMHRQLPDAESREYRGRPGALALPVPLRPAWPVSSCRRNRREKQTRVREAATRPTDAPARLPVTTVYTQPMGPRSDTYAPSLSSTRAVTKLFFAKKKIVLPEHTLRDPEAA